MVYFFILKNWLPRIISSVIKGVWVNQDPKNNLDLLRIIKTCHNLSRFIKIHQLWTEHKSTVRF